MFEDCIIVLDKALEIKPEEMFPLYLKSVLYNELGRYNEVENFGRELLKIHSNNKVILNHFGIILSNLDTVFLDLIL